MKNILKNILSALSDKNIKFSDLKKLILDLGFSNESREVIIYFLKKALQKL
jgi:hypothetical protein